MWKTMYMGIRFVLLRYFVFSKHASKLRKVRLRSKVCNLRRLEILTDQDCKRSTNYSKH